MRGVWRTIGLVVCVAWLGACSEPPAQLVTADPSDDPIAGLDAPMLQRFAAGDADFAHVFRPSEGLGPRFIRRTCEGCHADDGRGPGVVERVVAPTPTSAESLEAGAVFRPSAVAPLSDLRLPTGVRRLRRLPPAVFGRGYLDAVLDSELARVERHQARTGVVSGRVVHAARSSRIPAREGYGHAYGRFGLKAERSDLEDFVAGAYLDDMGLSSPHRPEEPDQPSEDARPGIDVDRETVERVADYVRLLAIPSRTAEVGSEVFAEVGCADCHVPSLRTDPAYPIPQLAGIDAPIFSDLLVHDMGEALSSAPAPEPPPPLDGLHDVGTALRGATEVQPVEWRTSPLIGIRHLSALLHDGRARNVTEAIEAHAGEAAPSRARFERLVPARRARLVRYVESL